VSTSPAPQIGLLNLPSLQSALAACGVQVVGGSDFREAAKAIATALRDEPGMPLLVADHAGAGQMPWLERWLPTTQTVIVALDTVAAGLGDEPRPIEGNTTQVPRAAAPIAVPDLLAQVGLTCPARLQSAFLSPSGQVMVRAAKPQPSSTQPAAPAGWVSTSSPAAPPQAPVVPQPPASPPLAPPTPPAAQPEPEPEPVAPAPAASDLDDLEALPATLPAPVPAAPTAPVDELPSPRAPQALEPTVGGARTIFSMAAKGGVGKSSFALALAQRAARLGRLRVVVIDGNRGQGDLRKYLRLTRASLPTVYDIAAGSDPQSAIVRPAAMEAHRPNNDRLDFAAIFAPLAGMSDQHVVTTQTYAQALAAARSVADLVIVDTQISEDSDTSGLFDDLWVPALTQYAHAVMVSDLSIAGVDNTGERLRQLRDAGVPADHISTVLNRVPPTVDYHQQRTAEFLGQFGWFRGAVPAADAFVAQSNHGEIPWEQPTLAPILDSILFAVTDLEVFAPSAQPTQDSDTRRRGGLFGWLGR